MAWGPKADYLLLAAYYLLLAACCLLLTTCCLLLTTCYLLGAAPSSGQYTIRVRVGSSSATSKLALPAAEASDLLPG